MNEKFAEKRAMKIISVIGSGGEGPQDQEAITLGRFIGRSGYVLINGGGSGIMKASACGASEAGGLIVGILPSSSLDDPRFKGKFPNPYVHIPIFTGLSDARNVIIVKSADIVVAFRGGAGTLSEISLAIKSQKFVLIVDWKDLVLPHSFPERLYRHVENAEEAAGLIEQFLNNNI